MVRDALQMCVPFVVLMVAASLPASVAAEQLPAWWPAEVPVFDGATVAEVDHAEDKGLPSVDFKVPTEGQSMASIVGFYREALEGKGWAISKARSTGLAHSITATKQSIDKRVIVTAKKPGTMFNKDKNAFLLEVIVYESVP